MKIAPCGIALMVQVAPCYHPKEGTKQGTLTPVNQVNCHPGPKEYSSGKE